MSKIGKSHSKKQDLLQSKKIDIGMDDLRSYLWNPRYAKWVVEGGFDYRNYFRRSVKANLALILEAENERASTFNPIMINRIDFPRSMGDVVKIQKDFIGSVLKQFHTNYSVTANVLKSFPISIADAAQYDLMTQDPEQRLEAFFVDPFPADSLWATSPLEKQMLAYIANYYSDMTAEILEIDRERIYSAVLCSPELYCQMEEDNLEELKKIIDAALKDDEQFVIKTDALMKQKNTILKEELGI